MLQEFETTDTCVPVVKEKMKDFRFPHTNGKSQMDTFRLKEFQCGIYLKSGML